jgi:hypothetical protein
MPPPNDAVAGYDVAVFRSMAVELGLEEGTNFTFK